MIFVEHFPTSLSVKLTFSINSIALAYLVFQISQLCHFGYYSLGTMFPSLSFKVWMVFSPLQLWHMTCSNVQFLHFLVHPISLIITLSFSSRNFVCFHIFPLVKYFVSQKMIHWICFSSAVWFETVLYISNMFPSINVVPFLPYLSFIFVWQLSKRKPFFLHSLSLFFLHCQLKLVPKILRNLFFVNNNKNLMNYIIKFFWGKNNSLGEITVQSLFYKWNI